jgi:hypothetical protein
MGLCFAGIMFCGAQLLVDLNGQVSSHGTTVCRVAVFSALQKCCRMRLWAGPLIWNFVLPPYGAHCIPCRAGAVVSGSGQELRHGISFGRVAGLVALLAAAPSWIHSLRSRMFSCVLWAGVQSRTYRMLRCSVRCAPCATTLSRSSPLGRNFVMELRSAEWGSHRIPCAGPFCNAEKSTHKRSRAGVVQGESCGFGKAFEEPWILRSRKVQRCCRDGEQGAQS